MSWHYRAFKVIPKKIGKGTLQPEPYYCVKEYYTLPFGRCWSRDPEHPQGETKQELIEVLERMLKDVKTRRAKVEKEK